MLDHVWTKDSGWRVWRDNSGLFPDLKPVLYVDRITVRVVDGYIVEALSWTGPFIAERWSAE